MWSADFIALFIGSVTFVFVSGAEVSRCTFLYHYIPPLFYAELLLANIVDLAPPRLRWRLFVVLSTLFVIAFLYWAPWIYGIPLSVMVTGCDGFSENTGSNCM